MKSLNEFKARCRKMHHVISRDPAWHAVENPSFLQQDPETENAYHVWVLILAECHRTLRR